MFSTRSDSDLCLKRSPGWNAYTCAGSKKYCDSWSKDVRRCCPDACGNGEPLTESNCNTLEGSGKCTYPFIVETLKCSNNMKKELRNLEHESGTTLALG